MDKLPFIFTREDFQNFIDLLVNLFNKKYDVIEGEKLSQSIGELEKNKVDVVAGKGLSTVDFTQADKNKLDALKEDAEANVITGIYYGDMKEPLPVEDGYVKIPGISEEDLPEYLPNEFALNVYNDSNYNISDNTAVPSVAYNGSSIQTLTAHDFFKSGVYALEVSKWNSRTYNLVVDGLDRDSVIFVSPRPDYLSLYAECGIKATEYSKNKLVFSCLQTPTESVHVQVIYSSTKRNSNGKPTYL